MSPPTKIEKKSMRGSTSTHVATPHTLRSMRPSLTGIGCLAISTLLSSGWPSVSRWLIAASAAGITRSRYAFETRPPVAWRSCDSKTNCGRNRTGPPLAVAVGIDAV